MNPCHAATLALVGWYLMVAPQKSGLPDITAPLATWKTVLVFDAGDACNDEVYKARKLAAANLMTMFKTMQSHTGKEREFADALVTEAIRCVATDDPRLKEN